jgi:hypothetical protein
VPKRDFSRSCCPFLDERILSREFLHAVSGASLMSLQFWIGIGAAQKGARANARQNERRKTVISIVASALIALLAVFGLAALLLSQHWD